MKVKKNKKRTLSRSFVQGAVMLALGLQMVPSVFASSANQNVAITQTQEEVTVSGRVTSQADNSVVVGATIKTGNKVLGVTDVKGEFAIKVAPNSMVVFESIGFLPQSRNFAAAQTGVTIQLNVSTEEISEVVVTALGIKREQKALGYSVSTVSGEELTEAMPSNWTDALSGKVAGLNLVKSGAGPGGSTDIILRGETSLTGDNTALIVVDGIVMGGGSTMTGTGSGNYLSDDSPVDFGSGLGDINPDDIESVSVLKGPGASALYGYRGAHGAIIITTKSGKSNQKGLGVSINSNTSVGTINRWPAYQNEYGQGVRGGGDLYYSYGQSEDGPSTLSTSSAWGPRFDGQMYYQYNPEYYRETPPERSLWKPYKNNRKDFFDPNVVSTNSVSLSGGNDQTTARLSYTNVYNDWIVPNTGYKRNTIALQVNHKVGDKLTLSSKVNYNNKASDNLPNTGYNNQTYMYFVRGIVPNWDSEWFKQNWIPGEEGINQSKPFSSLLDNPYTIAYDMLNSQNRNSFIGNVQATYDFSKLFSLMVRTGIDFGHDQRMQRRPFGSNKYANGYYREQGINTQEINSDFLFRYNDTRNKDYQYGAAIGGSMMNNKYTRNDMFTKKLVYPNVYNFANTAEALTVRPYRSEYAVNSLFGMANFGYKNYWFTDFTYRVDWASTLASPLKNEVKPFFYPSLNTSFIFSDAFELPKDINFLKLRLSAASVGGGGKVPYRTSYNYGVIDNFEAGLGNPTTIPNLDLKYEKTVSYEIGTDIRMFRNRLEADITLYKNNTYDQILPVPIDPSSGYRYQVVNAGNVENKGIEISISGKPFVNKEGLQWKPYANFTAYDTKVVSLPDSVQSIVLSTIYGSRGTVEARVGGKFGDMYGFGYDRNAEGQIIYDEQGLPLTSSELLYLGNANANIKVGFGNEFRYKDFRLNILFDGQFGGKGYSLTHAVLMEEGKLEKTLPGRYNGIIGNGVIANADGTYSPNEKVANAGDYYYAHFNRDQMEANTFSTDYIKLREVRVDYTLPNTVTKRLGVQKALIGLYGRDLFVISDWPSFDPEFGSLTGSGIQKGAEIAQFPSTRTVGLNLSVTF